MLRLRFWTGKLRAGSSAGDPNRAPDLIAGEFADWERRISGPEQSQWVWGSKRDCGAPVESTGRALLALGRGSPPNPRERAAARRPLAGQPLYAPGAG